MKRFCHSKEIEILFLLFCSAETQKDLVIRIDSLLLCVHIEQTTGIFFFPLFFIWLGSGWDKNKSNAMHWQNFHTQLFMSKFYFDGISSFYAAAKNNSNRITISASLTIALGGVFSRRE
jgi:hypothetical protein